MPKDNRGLFITFEGGEGVGKSTQIELLANRLHDEQGIEVCLVREPGGTRIGEMIRAILLDKDQSEMDPLAELFLYEAARAQIVREVIIPALEAGKIVLCDRYLDSTLAYQGYARGLDADIVRMLNAQAAGNAIPDCTFLLLLDPAEGIARAADASATGADRIESAGIAFHERVLAGFKDLAANEPQRFCTIDAAASIDAVHERVWGRVLELFGEGGAR